MKSQKKITAFLLMTLMLIKLQAQMTTYSYPSTTTNKGNQVIQNQDGSYMLAGTMSLSGTNRVFLLKTDENRNIIWMKNLCAGEGNSIIKTSTQEYIIVGRVASESTYDLLIVKTNTDGDTIWTKRMASTPFKDAYSICEASDGGFVIAGRLKETSMPWKAYLLKTNTNGGVVWEKQYAPTGLDAYAYSVKRTSDNGYIIVGMYNNYNNMYFIKTDITGSLSWSLQVPNGGEGHSVYQTNDGGYIATGSTESSATLVKVSQTGSYQWNKNYFYGTTHFNGGYSVIQLLDNNFVLVGETSDGMGQPWNIYIVKTNSSGDTICTKRILNGNASSVIQTNSNKIMIAGGTGNEAFLMELDNLLTSINEFGLQENKVLKLNIYPSSQLGGERECLELLQIGSLDITKVSAAVLENFIPEYKVLSLPYLFRDKAHMFSVFDNDLFKSLKSHGVLPVTAGETGRANPFEQL